MNNFKGLIKVLILLSSLGLTQTAQATQPTVILKTILDIEQSQLDYWWKYMTPIEKRNYIHRLKQGNRIQTLTRDEFYEVENKRLLEWVNYRVTLDGGL